MAQAGNVILGRFSDLVRMYKAPPAHCMTEEFYETDPRRDFARGFAIQSVGPLPIAFAKQIIAAKGSWGWGLRQQMMDYNHWGAIAVLGELLPKPDNRVTWPTSSDRWGIPVAKVTFGLYDNDKKLVAFARKKVEEVMWAAGAEEVVQESRFAHLVGGARMGADPRTSVTDKFGRTHDIDNLFVCDGSLFPTQGSANPGLTIQSLAARTADYLINQSEAIFRRGALEISRRGRDPVRPQPPRYLGIRRSASRRRAGLSRPTSFAAVSYPPLGRDGVGRTTGGQRAGPSERLCSATSCRSKRV